MTPSDPVLQVAAAAFCAAVLACVLLTLSKRIPASRTSIVKSLRVAGVATAALALLGAAHAVRLGSEIDDGNYALLRVAMPVDPRLVPVVSKAMEDGRITYGEYDTMGFKGAIPDRRVMRTIVAQDVKELQP